MTDEAMGRHSGVAHRSTQTGTSAFVLEKRVFYLTVLVGFFGSAFFTVDLGPFSLFPYRIGLVSLWILLAARLLVGRENPRLGYRTIWWYLVFLAVWLAYAVLSVGWAASTTDAFRDVIFLLMGVSVIFLATYYLRRLSDLSVFFQIWLGVFCGLLVLGLWENLTGEHLAVSSLFGETRARFKHIPSGVFHNPNDYATYISLSIPFALIFFRYSRNLILRGLALVAVVIAIYLILATGSRANMVAVLMEAVFFFAIILNLGKKFRWGLLVSAGLFLILIVFPSAVQPFFSGWLDQLNSLGTSSDIQTSSLATRINLAYNSLWFLWSTGGFGVGAGNAEYYMLHFAKYDTHGILNPHNWWLEILTNYGIFVFAGYMIFFGSLLFRLTKIYKRLRERWERMICETLLISLVGFVVGSTSASSIMAIKAQWFLFALALAFLNYVRIKNLAAKL